jgi:diguanylate cyclase (GGDEF)-like protein/PAS domain S-box-containing protein
MTLYSRSRLKFFNKALFRNNGVARRIMVALILFSSVITTVITCVELYIDYRADLSNIDERIESIRKVYLPTLIESVWVAERTQILTQLNGLLNLRDIEYIGIEADGETKWSAGQRVSTRQIESTIPLLRMHRGQGVKIGELHVVASVDNVLGRLWSRFLVMLVSNGIKTLLVTAFVLLIFQALVGQHLEHISGYLRRLGKGIPGAQALRLNRPATGRWRPDALDHVSLAINSMRDDLLHSQSELIEANHRLNTIIQSSPLAIYTRDLNNIVTSWNPAAEKLFGWRADEIIGQRIRTVPADKTTEAESLYQRVVAGETIVQADLVRQRRDGSLVDISLTLSPLRDAAGHIYGYLAITADISQRKSFENQLHLLAQVFDQSNEGLVITDADGNIVKMNPGFATISGYSEAEVLGQNPRIFSSGRHDKDFYRAMWETIKTQGHWQGEIWNRRKDGSVYPELITISQVLDTSGKVTHYVSSSNDITQHKEDEERIQRLAHFDILTGLPNRVLLTDRASHALSMAARMHEPLALMFIDLDHFKNINDSLGHRTGDKLLITIANRLKSLLREQDTVSRLGGDEFVMLLPGTSPDGAAHVAEKMLQTVAASALIEQYELSITPSIGIAMYPGDGEDFDTLSKRADVAMYRVKAEGRNNYRFFTAEMQSHSARALQLEASLRRALARDQLFLHYQPQMSLKSGRIIGAEVLLRWQHPELGLVSPTEFIPIAEVSGLILSIGEWVLRTSLHQLKTWIDNGMAPITLAVNLSAVQFRHPHLPALVTQILDEVQLAPHHLELELTESAAMSDPLKAVAVMDDLHARGIRMSIDDFGTGYSSLSYLKRFQAYKLKIDQAFVRDITDDPEDKAIVSAIISMASSLDMQTIAEGVETEGQLEFLRQQGCDQMQGFFFSKPLTTEAFEAFFRQQS